MERTWSSEAMVQPGTMARSGVRAAMGMRPRSASPARSCAGAEGGFGVVEGVAAARVGGEGWVFEVPHERGGVEEVDGGDAEFGRVGKAGLMA